MRAVTRMDADAVCPDADRAGGVTQVPPGGVDASLLVVVLLDVVPVGDVGMTHAGSILAPRSSARDRTAEDAGVVEVPAEQKVLHVAQTDAATNCNVLRLMETNLYADPYAHMSPHRATFTLFAGAGDGMA